MIKAFGRLALLFSFTVSAQEFGYDSPRRSTTISKGQDYLSVDEATRLRRYEAALNAILENAEYIQLKDGRMLEIRDLYEGKSSQDSLKETNRVFEAKSGTGFGG